MWLVVALSILYGWLLLTALTNLFFMRRPKVSSTAEARFCVLIPARNEEKNLSRLLPILKSQGIDVYVFDDESTDRTAEVVLANNAKLIQPQQPLPDGWTGKNRACHELAKVSAEDSPHEWFVFLDADTIPCPEFKAHINDLIEALGPRYKMISGFPTMLPGQGLEPLYLSWVPWILLSANAFGLQSLLRKGHPRFTNGQFGLWHSSTYFEVNPNQQLSDKVLEDILIGRLMAKQGRKVEIVNLSKTFQVEMYRTFREALDGMSKNTFQVTGSTVGVFAQSLLFLLIAWGWLIAPNPYRFYILVGLILTKLITDRMVRAVWWTFPLIPITSSLAAYTCWRSWLWHKRGTTTWKGRVYKT